MEVREILRENDAEGKWRAFLGREGRQQRIQRLIRPVSSCRASCSQNEIGRGVGRRRFHDSKKSLWTLPAGSLIGLAKVPLMFSALRWWTGSRKFLMRASNKNYLLVK
jgi:hypothetical protein